MAAEAVFTAAGRLTQRVRADVDHSEARCAPMPRPISPARHGSTQAMGQWKWHPCPSARSCGAQPGAVERGPGRGPASGGGLAAGASLLHRCARPGPGQCGRGAWRVGACAPCRGGCGRAATRAASQAVEDRLQRVAERAQGACKPQNQTEALVREVTGQGPEKTLANGFAIVRTLEGARDGFSPGTRPPALEIQFRDRWCPPVRTTETGRMSDGKVFVKPMALQRHAQTLRNQDEPNIDDLRPSSPSR